MLKVYICDDGTKYVSIRERMVPVTTDEVMEFLEQHHCKNFWHSATGKTYIKAYDKVVSFDVLDFWFEDLEGEDYIECIDNWFCKGRANRDDAEV